MLNMMRTTHSKLIINRWSTANLKFRTSIPSVVWDLQMCRLQTTGCRGFGTHHINRLSRREISVGKYRALVNAVQRKFSSVKEHWNQPTSQTKIVSRGNSTILYPMDDPPKKRLLESCLEMPRMNGYKNSRCLLKPIKQSKISRNLQMVVNIDTTINGVTTTLKLSLTSPLDGMTNLLHSCMHTELGASKRVYIIVVSMWWHPASNC